MAGRTVAIGDVHGCSAALDSLLDEIVPSPEDTVVTLGDYIDRGPDSRGVLDRLIHLSERCRLVPLRGDHEEMSLDALGNTSNLQRWLRCGGAETLRSYGWAPGRHRGALTDWIPEPHWAFLGACRPYYETATHVFVHAGYIPELPMEDQSGLALRWRATDPRAAVPYSSSQVAVVGHTPQLSGEVLDLGFLVCIDTNCVRGGWLTALDTSSGRIWQADRAGKLRRKTAGPDALPPR